MDYQRELQRAMKECDGLYYENWTLRQNIQALLSENEAHLARLQQTQEKNKKLEDVVAELLADKQQLVADIDTKCITELYDMESKCVYYMHSHGLISAENETLKRQMSRINKKIEKLETESKELKNLLQNKDNELLLTKIEKDKAVIEAETDKDKLDKFKILVDHWYNQQKNSEEKLKNVERELNILKTSEKDLMQSGSASCMYFSELEDSGFMVESAAASTFERSGRYKSFHVSQVQNCQKCHQGFRGNKWDEECYYHPNHASDRVGWQRMAEYKTHANDPQYNEYKYWICCNKFSRKRPKGCQIACSHVKPYDT